MKMDPVEHWEKANQILKIVEDSYILSYESKTYRIRLAKAHAYMAKIGFVGGSPTAIWQREVQDT